MSANATCNPETRDSGTQLVIIREVVANGTEAADSLEVCCAQVAIVDPGANSAIPRSLGHQNAGYKFGGDTEGLEASGKGLASGPVESGNQADTRVGQGGGDLLQIVLFHADVGVVDHQDGIPAAAARSYNAPALPLGITVVTSTMWMG